MSENVKRRKEVLVKRHDHPFFSLKLKKNNIVVIQANSDIEYERHHIEQIATTTSSFTENKKHLILIIPTEFTAIGFEGLKTLSEPKTMRYAIAKAYVVKNTSQRLMINFYLNFFKPKIPVKIFNDERQAQVWLLRKHRHLVVGAQN